MRKRILFVATFALGHTVVTVLLTIAAFGAVMQGFDGGPRAPPRLVSLLIMAGNVITWPLIVATPPTLSSTGQYAVLYANGLVWGIAVLCGWILIRRVWPRPAIRVAGGS